MSGDSDRLINVPKRNDILEYKIGVSANESILFNLNISASTAGDRRSKKVSTDQTFDIGTVKTIEEEENPVKVCCYRCRMKYHWIVSRESRIVPLIQ